ncbi:NAD(+) diphosphatase [Alishewanella sp. SMS8]|uniref:NAD(+) diphosphatase n=1 Tax=unclassified Alishewanella TaxID=2628974 RepID=UPI0027403217|nr:NAD(+) diphosphatase [Alishewanella sp. SMS8]MDP4945529.1 NAD(+) diphosphatase [Alishewanella sp.]MDP5206118.1 NAD(+) diphosphatase [Alishewanella sp. SMS9]MDP5035856.1 NAD(+) diphosphatase [Alishewanella sp.]MDP5186968.1 NAD(+) diphosphatase [Alishewanella sp.]MDP5460503.1 NAD(+) diphosphatase [Alishewanella sp. SMS8]
MIKHSVVLSAKEQAYWFIVNQGRVFLSAEGTLPFGSQSHLPIASQGTQICWIGEYQQHPCYLMVFDDQATDETQWHSARVFLTHGEALFQLAARATQVALFLQTHRFCGQCGSAMHLVNWELASLCHKCGHRCYPRIAPCVLVAIVNDGKILLARSSRHKAGFFSVLAGFVESAETLEQAAIREVKEEVGVDITDLQYVGSQPWPFPHSLMTGFLAQYAGGEIVCQPHEIEEAYWCELDKLPQTPGIETLSGQLIALAQQCYGRK